MLWRLIYIFGVRWPFASMNFAGSPVRRDSFCATDCRSAPVKREPFMSASVAYVLNLCPR